MPSWVGDVVMATPALRVVRSSLPGAFVGVLLRPPLEEVVAGLGTFDEAHVDRAEGVMGPKHVAGRLRPRRYEASLLLTNSFSTALIARLAGIPRRVGYSRDARAMLLTHGIEASRRAGGGFAPVPAVVSYLHAAEHFLWVMGRRERAPEAAWPTRWKGEPIVVPEGVRLELAVTESQRARASEVLSRGGLEGRAFALLNPGGNNAAKRWPAERFARVAEHLWRAHGLAVAVNASPGEGEVSRAIAACASCPVVELGPLGGTLGSLKGVVERARLMVTNDTGPRHFAAALGVPVVTLFGPTDPRWTTIPAAGGEEEVVADPTLPAGEVADDHAERCRIEGIEVERVAAACDRLLSRGG